MGSFEPGEIDLDRPAVRFGAFGSENALRGLVKTPGLLPVAAKFGEYAEVVQAAGVNVPIRFLGLPDGLAERRFRARGIAAQKTQNGQAVEHTSALGRGCPGRAVEHRDGGLVMLLGGLERAGAGFE